MSMNSTPLSACPICSRVLPHDQLYDHMALESPQARQNTIRVIQGHHADWLAEQGVCEPCWKSFRDAGRVLHMLKAAHKPTAVDYWTHAEPRALSEPQDTTDNRSVY